MKVLVFTQMYPSDDDPHNGTFIFDEVEVLKSLVEDIKVLHFDTKKSKLLYFKSILLFKKAVQKYMPDIVHCHHTFCVFIAWLSGFKNLVLTFHEGEYTSKESYFTLLRREGISKFLVLSKIFKRFCLKKARHIFDVTGVLGNCKNIDSPFWPGVNTKIFSPIDKSFARKKICWDHNKKYILFPGSATDSCKRFDVAEEVLKIVRRWHSEEVILFQLTNIPHNDVPYYMCASDLMLLVSDYEASPMVVKEAVACGLPVVCYNVGDVSTVLSGVPWTFVIQPDVNKAATMVNSILNERCIERHKSFLPENYEIEYVARKIKAVYEQCVGV